MPSAQAILWFMAAFLAAWGMSLVVRGLLGDRTKGPRRCPSCLRPAGEGRSCAACGYEARSEGQMRAGVRDWKLVAGGAAVVAGGVVAGCGGYVVWGWFRKDDAQFPVSLWDSMALGVAVFAAVLVGWALRGERSRGRRRCPRCWYDMSGAGLRCPECGKEVRHTRDLYRARRRWKAAGAASLLLIVAAMVQGVPRVQRGGWRATVPTTVLIAGMRWLPDALVFKEGNGQEEDWTLLGRFDRGRLWEWQQDWVKAKGGRMLREARGARELWRGLHFSEIDWTPVLLARAIDASIASLLSGDDTERDAAVDCLDAIDAAISEPGILMTVQARLRLPDLKRVLNDPATSARVGWSAAWLISVARSEQDPGVRRMLELMGSSGRLAAMGWVRIIQQTVRASPATREALNAALEDADPAVAVAAAQVVGGLGRSLCDADSAERLLRVLRGDDDQRACAAGLALCRSKWEPGVTIPAMLEQIEGPRACRGELAGRLWWFEEDLLPYLGRIAELLEDPDPKVRVEMILSVDTIFEPGKRDLAASAVYPIIERLQRDADAKVGDAATDVILRRAAPAPSATEPSTTPG